MGEDKLAKKKKDVEIIEQELTPIVLAEVKDQKKASILSLVWLVIILAVFIGAVYYLPDFANYFNQKFNPDADPIVTNDPITSPKNDEDDEVIEEVLYTLEDGLEISNEVFTIRNIRIVNNEILFDLYNNSKEILELDNYNYFLNLYSQKVLLQRIMLDSAIVNPEGSITLNYILNDVNVTSISIMEIDIKDYPGFSTITDETSNGSLVCSKDYESITYLLNDNKVYAIDDVYTVPIGDPNFTTLYSTYQALANTYNAIDGISSNVTNNADGLTFKTMLNLNSVEETSFNQRIFYPKDTEAKIIKFELEASGYICS